MKAPSRIILLSALPVAALLVLPAVVQSQLQSQPPAARSALSAAMARRNAQAFVSQRGVGRPGAPVPAAILLQARAQSAAMVQAQLQAAAPSTAWQPVGPMQVNTPLWGLVTGRVTSLAADPSDPSGNTLYVGTTGGGVWKATDAMGPSPSFQPLTDNLSAFSSAALTSLSIGAVTVQPGGTGVVLAGTGDPNDATDSWYGAGILRSTDGGATWSLIANATGTGNLGKTFAFGGSAIAAFAWSTTNPNEVVAAVSQSAYGGLVGVAVGDQTATEGIYYSQDAGATWSLATIEDGATIVENPAAQKTGSNAATAVVWNPVRKSFYAAVRYHGYYASSDGITWTRLPNQPGLNLTPELCTSNPGSSGSPACPIFRGALAVQPVTGDMFALTVDQNNLDQGLWQDLCGLTSGACGAPTVQFGQRISDAPLETPTGAIAAGDYNLWLAAVPSQQDTLLLAGTVDIWKCSLANSCAWRNTTNTQTCAAAQVAPGQHAAETTFASAGLIYFGNDGGLWRSTDAVNQLAQVCSPDDANHFQNLNAGLGSLAEVQSFSEDPGNPDTWMAALGALGTAAPQGNAVAWNQILGGESDAVAIDPFNPGDWYATSEFGVGINRCTQGSACNAAAFGSVAVGAAQVDNDVQQIAAPWLLDPIDSSSLIVGTCRVWRGAATGAGWGPSSLLSGILDGDQSSSFCNGNAEIRSLAAVANTADTTDEQPERMYAGMAGLLDGGGLIPGHVFTAAIDLTSQAASTVWSDTYASRVTNDVTQQFNPGEFDVSSIYADPHDATGQTVYVTIQGYSSAILPEPLLYRSTDAGAHWSDITSNLPNAPANSIVVDPNNANIVYAATDTGVYITQNVSNCAASGSACWNVYGSGLPNAPVIALSTFFGPSTQALRAATYGRGIWQVDLATAAISVTTALGEPQSLNFSPQQVQTISAPQTVLVTNTGQLNLSVSSIVVSGDFAESDTCAGQAIAPGGTCQLQVSFDPTLAGTREGMLTLYANVAGGQLTVSLRGSGLTPANLTLTPTSLAFAQTNIHTQSAPQIVTLANTGGIAVTLNGASVTGDFAVKSSTCGASLGPKQSCALSIVFAPTASGSRSGMLSVTDSQGTQTELLTGTGWAAATDALAPLALTFSVQQVGTASPAQILTLTNTGDDTLTGIAVSASGDFSAANNCGALLQGHGSCTIAVTYAPAVIGPESGTVVVSDEFRSQTVELAGTGRAPPGVSAVPASVDFGGYAAGTTSPVKTITVTNSGGVPLASLAAAVSANFAIAGNNCPALLAVGSACQIGVTFTAPASIGQVAGTLSVSSASLAQPLTVRLSGATGDFSIGISGSSSAVLVSGQTASFTVQVAGLGGIAGNVVLSCGGAPQNASCTFGSPNNGVCPAAATASLVLNGQNASSVNVCVATGVAAAASASRKSGPGPGSMAAAMAMLLPLALFGVRRKRWAAWLVLFAAVLLVPTGCGVKASAGAGGGSTGGQGGGGGSSPQKTTPSGAYILTVQGVASNITHNVGLNVTVE